MSPQDTKKGGLASCLTSHPQTAPQGSEIPAARASRIFLLTAGRAGF